MNKLDFSSVLKPLLAKSQPHSSDNKDAAIFTYHFATELEKYSKKYREQSLEIIKSMSDKSDEKDCVFINGKLFAIDLSVSETNTFDKEIFISKIIEKYPEIDRHVLRELVTTSVKTSTRKSFKVRDKSDD